MYPRIRPVVASVVSSGMMLGAPLAAANPCNPCAPRARVRTAQANPCAAKNPCGAKNPCAPKK